MDETSNRKEDFSYQNNSTNKNEAQLPKIRENKLSTKEINIKNSFRKIKSEEEKEEEERIKNKVLRNASPRDICIEALKIKPSKRTKESIKTISFYLQMIKNFMNIFKGQVENEELNELLFNISSKLKYEEIEKNKLICRFGDKSNKFYLILKGKVTFYIPKLIKQYFSQEEYIKFLLNLRINDEIELIKTNMETNNYIYNLGDDFDNYILNSLKKHEKKKQNNFSEELYNKFKEIKELIEKEKRKHQKENEEKIPYTYENIGDYLERCLINISNDPHEAEEYKRNQLDIYIYEKTNIFEDGEYFGFVGNRKNKKRSATAITLDDCQFAILYLDEYNEILDKINRSAKEKLYNLVNYNNLFTQISKPIFINKYSHMFKFNRYYLNNIIMDDTQYFNKIILFNSGEFILTVNKNIIELNELIIKLKRIKGMIMNIPEEKIIEESEEIKENENYVLNKNYISKSFYQKIIARQNIIISTIKKNMVIGYPDTIDPKTFMPLFNCKCISTKATGYSVERDMINLFDRDNYLRTTPSKVSLAKIDFYLKRLLEYKKNIMNKIDNLENSENNYNKRINRIKRDDIDYDNTNESGNTIKLINKSLDLKEAKKEFSDNEQKESNLNIYMKEKISRNKFQSKIEPKEIDKSFTKRKNIVISLPSLNLSNNNNNSTKKEFFKKISKLRQNIKKKKYLLRIIQNKSRKFVTEENFENKIFKMRFSNDKNYYNNLSNIFSKEQDQKKYVLDKYLKKSDDNILDPTINDIHRKINFEKKLSSILYKSNNIINNNDVTQLNLKQINNDGANLYTKNNLIRNMKLIFGNKSNNNNINNNQYSLKKKNLIHDSPKIFKDSTASKPNDSELKNVKLNYNNLSLDLDKIKNKEHNFINESNNYKLYNELYNEYIKTELDKSNNSDNSINKIHHKLKPEKKIKSLSTYQKIDIYKLKNNN